MKLKFLHSHVPSTLKNAGGINTAEVGLVVDGGRVSNKVFNEPDMAISRR